LKHGNRDVRCGNEKVEERQDTARKQRGKGQKSWVDIGVKKLERGKT
jgi:hypothetical protein